MNQAFIACMSLSGRISGGQEWGAKRTVISTNETPLALLVKAAAEMRKKLAIWP